MKTAPLPYASAQILIYPLKSQNYQQNAFRKLQYVTNNSVVQKKNSFKWMTKQCPYKSTGNDSL